MNRQIKRDIADLKWDVEHHNKYNNIDRQAERQRYNEEFHKLNAQIAQLREDVRLLEKHLHVKKVYTSPSVKYVKKARGEA